ncbi:beta strand repeat-containing protein [Herpetosiphon llansteffanensis]
MALLAGVLFVLQGSGAFAAPKPIQQAQTSAERPLAAPLLGSNDVLLSDMGGLGNADGSIAINPVVTYNATDSEYLVVWEGLDTATGSLNLHGQLIDAVTGLEIGTNDFLIADDIDVQDAYGKPQVVWNSINNEYLVIFEGDSQVATGITNELEIYAQRIAANGAVLGSPLRVSQMGTDGVNTADAFEPSVTYNATANQYAVVWYGDDLAGGRVDGEFEVYVQLLGYSGGNLVEVGSDVKVSDVGTTGSAVIRPEDPNIVWNSVNNEYLVVWRADDSGTDGDFDVYGQRLNASLAEVGADDFLIADNPNQDSFDINLGYNPTNNLYLVIWSGDNVNNAVYNVYGQLIAGASGALSGGLLTLSSTSDGVSTDPVITYNSRDNQFIIAWMAPSAAGNAEREIFSQKINAATGARIAPFDVQVSDMGPNGNDTYFANGYIGIAYGGPNQNHTLVVWNGADNRDGQATGESEVFGQLITPILNVRKTITSATTNVDAFDTVTYQIEVEHATVTEGADTVSLSLADAANLNLSDVLPAQLSNVTLTSAIISDGTGNTNVAGNFSVTGNNLTTTTPMPLRYRSNGNNSQKLTLVLSSKVANTALAGATVGNVANATWSNSASLTTVTGLSDSSTSANLSLAKAFTVTKSSLESNALIGQDVTYYLDVALIEGTTNSLQFVDNLPANTSYVAGSISVANFNGMTVNGLTAGVSGQTLTINASSVVNPGNIDNAATADSDVFRLSYQVKVLDVPANVSGVVLTNNVNASASPSQVDNGNSHSLTIVEPLLDVSKTIVGSSSGVDAGDTVRYQIRVNHTAASTAYAYDVSVVDNLSALLGSPIIQAATISDGATTTNVASNFTINGAGQLSTTTATNLDINTNGTIDQTLIITVSGTITNAVTPGSTIANTANIAWRNLVSVQRSNYNDSSSAPNITVPASFGVTKTVVSGINPTIGQVVSYQLATTVLEGTTNNLQWVDTLPTGMSYVPGSATISNANGMTIATLNASLTGQVLTLSTSSVLNPGNVNNAAAADTDSFNITYQATVNDVAGNVAGTVLTNDVDATADGVPADNNNSVSVTIAEPILAIDKTLQSATTGVDAFDTVQYRITINHTGASTANAFGLNVSDDMPATLQGTVISSATIGATNVSANFSINGSGDLVTTTPPNLALGETLILNLTGTVRNTVNPGGTIANAATVVWRNGVNVQRASYTATDLAPSITIPASFSVTKTVASPGANVAVGQTVTYQLSTTVIEGTTNNIQWVDTLPTGMSYVPGSAVVSNANGMTINGFTANLSGQVLTINATSVTNPGNVNNAATADTDSFTLTYQATVNDIAGNVAGTVLTNDVDASANPGLSDNNNSASVTVVEPILSIDKSITTNITGVDAGDTVRYRIDVAPLAASNANAFGLNLSDDMPAGIQGMVIESATISDGATTTDVASNFSINGSGDLVTITPPDLLLNTNGTNDQRLAIIVVGKVRDQINPGGTIANAATVTWRNQAGVQRANYTATDLAPTIMIANNFSVTKTVAAPGSEVGAGATVTYRLTTSLIEGTTDNIQWVDTLPVGLSYVANSAIVENANGMTVTGFNASLSGQVLTINATNIVNPGNVDNAAVADTDSFTLTYQATVAGNATSGTLLTNDVDASADPGLSDTNNQVTVTVVEPELTLSKTIDSVTTGIDAGDEVRYLIKVQPTVTSGANATNLMITDTLPSQLTATSILSATVSDGATTTDVASNFAIVGGQLRTTGSLGLDLNTNGTNDEVLTVMVRGLVATSTTPLSTITNTANLTWRNLGGFFNPNYSVNATAPTINVASRWTVSKFIVPTITEVSIGQVVTYTVSTTVIEGTTLNPVWVDTIPTGMTYVPGSAQISNANGVTLNGFNVALSGQTLTLSATSIVNPGNTNNAGNVDIDTFLMTYQVVVDTVAGGTVLTNDLDSSASPSLVDNNNQVSVTVVEPTLSVAKTITTATGGVDAGDTVRYQIRVAHVPSSNSNATKVLLTDTLPLELQNLTLVSAIVSDGATSTNVSGDISLSGGVLRITGNINLLINTNGTNDQTLTVVVQGIVRDSINPAATIANTANISWSNASGISRPIYTATGSTPTITVPSVWSVTKAISPAASTVSPGQVVEYTLTTTVLEGTTNNPRWVDSLPTGMSYVAGSAQVLDANGMTINGFNGSVSGQVLTISASNVVNPGNVNNATASDSDSFVIRYQASVDNDVSLGTTLTNDVDTSADPSLSDNNNAVSVSVREPALTINVGQTSDAQLEAGDPITFTVTIDNPAGANAQAANTVAITSSFTSNLSNLNLVDVQQTGGATGGSFAIVGNNLTTNTPATMPIGAQIVLTIRAQVNNTAAPASLVSMQSGVTWRNAADVSLPRYAKNASANTNIASFFAVTKALVPAASTVSAGQTLTYTLQVTVIEGSTSNIVLTDTLPIGMSYVGGSGTILSNGGITLNNFSATSIGQNVIFRVDPATNPGSYPAAGLDTDSFTLVYRTTIDQSVVSGTVLSNDVDASANPNLSDTNNAVSVTVVEPDLTINLSKLTADGGLDAADKIRQQVVISHTTSSLASAYDVDLNVDLPATFGTPALVSAIVSDGATSTNFSGNLGFDANGDLINTGNINLLINTNGSNDQRLTVIVEYTLPNSINQGATATSQGAITWKNASGTQLPSFTDSSNSLNYSVATSFALEKAVASTSIATTLGNQVTFGEVVTYVLTATVLEGTTNNLRFVDTLPAGLAYTNGSVTIANTNGMTVTGLTAMLSGQNLTIEASSVVNPGNVNAANTVDSDSFTITYQATVNGNPGLLRGTVLTNSVDGSADPSLSDNDNSVSVTVIEPSLEINKVVDDTTPDFGQVLNYTITISHTAQSASTAYELAIEDTLPVGLTPVAGSLTVISGPAPTSFAINGTNIEATFDSLALGSVSVLGYQARVATPPTLIIGSPLINNAELTWTSAQGTVNLERSYLDGADAPATVTSVDLAISKRVTPQVATPGTPVTFTINLTNTGNLQTSNIVLTDIVSPLLTNVTVSSQGLTINDTGANPGYVWTVSDLQPNASGSIQVSGIISPSLASDTTLVNNVSVSDDIDQILANNTASAIVAIVVPRVNFSLANYEVLEATGSATVTVQLNAPNPNSAVQVRFATSNGTANLSDYTPVTQTLTIPRGQTSVQVVVPIINDSTYELNETILLSLSNPVGTALGTPITSTITIINDDRAVVYIPMVMKPDLVDLVVDSIQVVNGTVRVTVRNAGTEPLAGGYWVDAYINPTQAPTAVNQPWNSLGNFGMAWAIPTNAPALAPNATLTLISGGQYYRSDLSFVPPGQLNAGSRIYAQADSYGLTNYGAILETHEAYGGTYNNIRGPNIVPATTNLVFEEQRPSTPDDLIGVPERPASR